MEYITVPDTSIVEINHGSIIYRDDLGGLHAIDFATCAANFRAGHKNASDSCVGERRIDEGSFLFFTTGVRTRIVFEKSFVFNLFRPHFLKGTKAARFHRLRKHILGTGYTTFDLS